MDRRPCGEDVTEEKSADNKPYTLASPRSLLSPGLWQGVGGLAKAVPADAGWVGGGLSEPLALGREAK